MSNQFTSLPATAANGSGAAVDVSALGANKTIVVASNGAVYEPLVTIEFANDAGGTRWSTLTQLTKGQRSLSVACRWMRATVSNYKGGGAPTVSVGGVENTATFAELVATAGDGNGAEVDTSAMGSFKSVQITGEYRGTALIEISTDEGATWAQLMAFNYPSPPFQNAVAAASRMRVKRSGVPVVNPGLPLINIGASPDPGGGGSGDEAIFFNVVDYGAVGDGVTDDGPAFRATIAAAQASTTKGAIFAPGGTYLLGRDGANFWCISTEDSNLVFFGVKGKTVFLQAAGMPATATPLFRFNGGSRIEFRDIIIDGNWGNAVALIEEGSAGDELPQATISVNTTEGFPDSGTFGVVIGAGDVQTVTYTGKTGGFNPTFTGCTGGVGTLMSGAKLGILDNNTGLNQTTQVDPRNHGIMSRGVQELVITDCEFRDVYGDFIYTGYRTDPMENVDVASTRVRITGCKGYVSARNGFTLGQQTDDLTLRDNDFRYAYASAYDSEPQTNNQQGQNVTIDRNRLEYWWNPGNVARNQNQTMSITGGEVTGLIDANAAKNYRVTKNLIYGSVGISTARGVVFAENDVRIDFDPGAAGGVSQAPVFIDHICDQVDISNNDFYDRGKFVDGYPEAANPHSGVITIQNYQDRQPATIRVHGNRIRARNGRVGISVASTGGFAGAPGEGNILQTSSSHTATAVTANTVECAGAGWIVNSKIGWNVYLGGLVALIESNTADTLTLAQRNGLPGYGGAWNLPQGGIGTAEPTPAVGTFLLTVPSGIVSVEGNEIDCSNDGYGQGSYGIRLWADRSGMRVRVRGNNIKNANIAGVYCDFTSATVNPYVEIADNTAYDDQPAITCNSVVLLKNGTQGFDRLILRNNTKQGGVSRSVTGIYEGVWIEEDGDTPKWIGYGSPEGVVRAAIGSQFRRLDGGVAFYVKQQNGPAIDVDTGTGSTDVVIATGATTNIPSVTTTDGSCLIVLAIAAQPGFGSGDWDQYTNAALVSLESIYNFTSVGAVGIATGVKQDDGVVGVTTVRNNGAQSEYGPAAYTIALLPETSAQPPVHQASGTVETDVGGGAISVPWPTSDEVIEGDYALLFVELLEDDVLTVDDAAGFTELASSPVVGEYANVGTQFRVYENRAFRPTMDNVELSYVGNHIQAVIQTFRGAAAADAVGWGAK